MVNRKYSIYQVNAEYGELFEETQSYRDAFRTYQRESTPKTMYGITEQGDVTVIFSKG